MNSMTASDLLYDVGAIAAFAIVGCALQALGYFMTDLLTPGRLADIIWRERNQNAAILVSANLIAVDLIVFTAIRSSHDGLAAGLLSTAVYGILGLVFMALSFFALDALTPGKLGALLLQEDRHPAVWVSAAAHIAVALMICAAIS